MRTLGQAMRDAIDAEKAAAAFYESLIPKAEDADARAFLERMASEERAHARSIEAMAAKLDNGAVPGRPDTDVGDIETAPSWRAEKSISFDDALSLALEAENNAALYYDALADFAEGEVADFFRALAHTEEAHAGVLRDAMKR